MSKEKTNTVRLGIFIIVGFVLFTIGIYNIGSRQNLFGATFRISSIFQNVKGLQPGNNVRYAGINVGSVSEIVLLNDSTIRVDMQLQKNIQDFLKKDAVASIGSDGLVGNMIVNISPKNGYSQAVENGDILESYTRVETEEVLNTLGNTTENIALLTINLLQIAENLNRGKGSLAMLVRDSIMATEFQSIVSHLNRTTQQINQIATQTRNQHRADE